MGKLDVYPTGNSENAKTLVTSEDKKAMHPSIMPLNDT